MSNIKRYVLRLAALGTFAIAIQLTAPALAAGNDTAVRLAMGPTSAALKNQNQGQQTSTETTGSTAKPHVKHKNKAAQ
jgi:hypothetical protein